MGLAGSTIALQILTLSVAQSASVPLSLFKNYIGKVDYRVTGGALRTQSNPVNACSVTNTSKGVLSAIPANATIKNAYLYWGASLGTAPSSTVTFQGQTITAQQSYQDVKTLNGSVGTFYGHRADVTPIVNAARNTSYTFTNLNFGAGPVYCNSQTVLGAWGLIVIYEDANIADYRSLNLYEGFVLSQKQVVNFTVDKIKVAPNPISFFTFLGWEGDATLGGSTETLRFNNSTITNSLNPDTQQFNSSITSPPSQGLNLANTYGIDLDTYDVRSATTAGMTSVTGTVSTGQDMVIQQAALVSVSTEVADLELTKTVSNATPAINTNVNFTLTVSNKGPHNATGVNVKDLLPAGLTFVSASASTGTYTSGTGIWNVGNLNNGASATLTLTATVTAAGTLTNTAQVSASSLPDPDSAPNNSLATEDDQASVSLTSTAPPPTTKSISGTVFEDVNYGGGSGRSLATSSGRTISGAEVELYRYKFVSGIDSGANAYFYEKTVFTDSAGKYTFDNLATNTQYLVRVVNDTVSSTRLGSNDTEFGVQTFRTNAAGGTVSDIVNEVGGKVPIQQDMDNVANNPFPTDHYINPTNGEIREKVLILADPLRGYAQSTTEVLVSTSNVTGVDFGFNFDTIVNINNTGQGSLRQFIANSNLLGDESFLVQSGSRKGADGVTNEPLLRGIETSIFMIPTAQLSGGLANIVISSLLPVISGGNANNTSIDGTTQTVNIGDTNTGTLGTGGTVGVDGLTLSKTQKPEISLTGAQSNGLELQADNVSVRGLGIYSFGITVDNGADIKVTSGTGATIEQNILGGTPTTFAAPAPGVRSYIGINVANADNGVIRNNLIGQTYYAVISFSAPGYGATDADGWLIENNEISGRSDGDLLYGDNFAIGANSGRFTLRGNLINQNRAHGTHFYPLGATPTSSGSGWSIENNTYASAGANISEPRAIYLWLKNSTNPSYITKNIFSGHPGAAIAFDSSNQGQKVQISQNRFLGNGGNAIDLGVDGISLNNGNITFGTAGATACGYETLLANQRLDFPLFQSSKLVGTTLSVTGQACPNSRIEIYKQYATSTAGDIFGVLQYGEGETYLGYLTTDSNGFFGGDLNVSGKLTSADKITGLTIDGSSNTSEFSNGVAVNSTAPSVSGTLYTQYSANNTLDSNEPHQGSGLYVELRNNSTNALVNATVTDVNGFYKFPAVATGTYKIIVPNVIDDLTIATNGLSASNTRSSVAVSATDVTNQDFGYAFPAINGATCTSSNGIAYAGTPTNQILAVNPATGGSIVAATTLLAADTSALAYNQNQKLVYYAQGSSVYYWDTANKTHGILNITDPNSLGNALMVDGTALNVNGGGMAFAKNSATGEIYLGVGNTDAGGEQFGLYRLKLDATGKNITRISKIDILTAAGNPKNFIDEWGDLVVLTGGDVYGITKNQGFWKYNLSTGTFTVLNASLVGEGKQLFLNSGQMYISDTVTKTIQAVSASGVLGASKPMTVDITDGSECGDFLASDLKLAQRITKINTTELTTINDPDNKTNTAQWISNFLRGKYSPGVLKPGDIVEYTTYFTSNGTSPAGTVNICSLIPKETEFLPDTYGLDQGIELTFVQDNGLVAYTKTLSNSGDNDGGELVAKANIAPGFCLKPPSVGGSLPGSENYEGAITVNVVQSGGTLPDLSHDRPKQGYIRFRVRVK